MDEKLRILMQNENLTASRLAEILEVKPAAISHILSGRNKPSYEMLCKIVTRFPQYNPYWLLGDDTEIRNSNINTVASRPSAEHGVPTTGVLFGSENEESEEGAISNIQQVQNSAQISTLNRSDIDRIIIVYQDQTFEELRPKK